MKRVNFDPTMDARKADAMEQFNHNADQAIEAVQAAAAELDETEAVDDGVL